MPLTQRVVLILTTLGMVLAMPCIGAHAQKVDSKPMVYWCPDRPADQQYVARPGPGCTPIVEKRPAGDEEDENDAAPPRPVNVVMGLPGVTYGAAELAEAGVKRISVGSALARAALGVFVRAAREMADKGSFTFSADAIGFAELEGFFRK